MADTLLTIGASVIGLLLAGNVFFVKRLVEKIENTEKIATTTAASATAAAASSNAVSNQMREIKAEIKELRRVEIDVAILKSHMGLGYVKPKDDED